MAKMYGLTGFLSGKLGNSVMAVSNGLQIVRQYQPIVANPKSAGQLAQRAKGNLVGRLSSFVPKKAISGLGVSNRARRGEFLRLALKAARVTSVGGVFTAKIDTGALVFSKGAARLSVISPVFEAHANYVSVTLTGVGTSSVPAAEYAAMNTRLVAVIFDSVTTNVVEVSTIIAAKPAQGSTAQTSIPVGFSGNYTADIYAIPMSTDGGTAVTISTGMAHLSDADIAAALSANANQIMFVYGKSQILGVASLP